MPYQRKKRGDCQIRKRWRLRRKTKDLDEIDVDLKPKNTEKLLNQEIDPDKPGKAQFYCIHCARYFINDQALNEHFRTKVHKRRMKALELEPYSIEESMRAAGFGNYIPPKKRKIETQKPVIEEESAKRSKVDEDEMSE